MDLFTAANNTTTTENGAMTYKSSMDPVLDLFSMGGALRSRNEDDISAMVDKAFNADAKEALKVLCYLRDIRNGGQGEKRTWKVALRYLVSAGKVNVDAAIDACVALGSWNDVFDIFTLKEYGRKVKKQYLYDLEHGPSLLEKWMPSIGGKDNAKAERLAKYLGLTPKQYRKFLSSSRSQLKIVEQNMCAKTWNQINYEHVPSRAMLVHGNAFNKNDNERYNSYIKSVMSGEKKINTSTLVPYEIMRQVDNNVETGYISSSGWGYGWGYTHNFTADNDTRNRLNTMWNNLPNVDYKANSSIVVADVSGSMHGNPMLVSTSLAIYFAERNTGIFANKFITFSEDANFIDLSDCNDIVDKYIKMIESPWDMNTNLQSVFDKILSTAIMYDLKDDDLPKTIYIVSDMEFDCATSRHTTNFEDIKRKYSVSGYTMPRLVFWNVNSRQDNTPVKYNDKGVALVSGCSPSVFNLVISEDLDPVSFMHAAIDNPIFEKHASEMIKINPPKKKKFKKKPYTYRSGSGRRVKGVR